MRYLASGKLLGVFFKTCTDGERYFIRFEASSRAMALIYAIGVEAKAIDPSQDSGEAWYQIECDDRTLDLIRESVDGIGRIVYGMPTFGQLVLFEEEHG